MVLDLVKAGLYLRAIALFSELSYIERSLFSKIVFTRVLHFALEEIIIVIGIIACYIRLIIAIVKNIVRIRIEIAYIVRFVVDK